MAKRQRTRWQTMTNKALYRKLNDLATRTHWKPEVSTSFPERSVVPVSLVTVVMLLLNDMNLIWYGNHVVHGFFQIRTCYIFWIVPNPRTNKFYMQREMCIISIIICPALNSLIKPTKIVLLLLIIGWFKSHQNN